MLKLPNKIRQIFMDSEKRVKEKYLDIIQNMSVEELQRFNKFSYRDVMFSEMRYCIDQSVADDIIKNHCHYMSNALNNESIGLLVVKRRDQKIRNDACISPIKTRRQTLKDTNTIKSAEVDIISDSFGELFITQNEHSLSCVDLPQESNVSDLDDSVTKYL